MITRYPAIIVVGLCPHAFGQDLAPVDRACGWKSLSGADAATAWRGYRQPSFPSQGWSLEGGVLTHAKGGGGGDVITTEQFGDFEFVCQFRTAPKANSGIIWRVAETGDTAWQTGPEYQVLDDIGYGAAPTDAHAAGALYDLYPPATGKTLHPAGEWNEARIYLRNGLVQHWLNGVKVVEVAAFDDAGKPTTTWLEKIAGSKFKDYPGFGVQARGHIALQDHGDEVAYRGVRARDLGTPLPREVALFNGKDLTGWEAFVPELKDADPTGVWSVENGVLVCGGNPAGYIRTRADYTNYVLRLQWRFPKQPGNSGVLLRMVGSDKVWPKSVEAQLHSGNAGDFWNIDGFAMSVDAARTNGRNTRKTHGAERRLGDWNEYEIIVNKGDVILRVNGEELNRATNVAEVPGKICLQSEGAEIHFRNIRLVPLD